MNLLTQLFHSFKHSLIRELSPLTTEDMRLLAPKLLFYQTISLGLFKEAL